MKIDTWFPTVIGVSNFEKTKELESIYYDHLMSVKSNYSTKGFYPHAIHQDPLFDELTSWTTEQVNLFANKFNFKDKYVPVESWFNDYEIGSYQPYHSHFGCIFSTAFYLKGDPDDSKILFKSPIPIDSKNPQNSSALNNEGDGLNEYTFTKAHYTPSAGKLLMFRSFLEHATETKHTTNPRVVISYNYDKQIKN